MLEAIGVVARYGIRSPLDLKIRRGCVHGILGPNGAGKSTALLLLAGLLPARSGSILLDGRSLGQRSRIELARELAFTAQDCPLDFDFKVRELVQMGRHPWRTGLRGLTGRDVDAVTSAMAAMGVGELADRSARTLSGGERQRVFIARALAQKTPVLLLDEPTAHLDFGRRAELMRTLSGLREQRDLTVVIALHDLNLAALFCDRVTLLSGGLRIAEGTPAEVMTEATMTATFGHGLRQVPGSNPPQFLPTRI